MGLFSDLFPHKKPRKGGLYLPSFLKRTRTGGSADIRDDSVNRTNQDLTQIRYGATNKEIVRDYSKVSPDLSHSLNNYIRFIITDSFTVHAKSLETDTIDLEATEMIQQFATRLNSLPPDYDGYRKLYSFASVAETCITQLLCNGCTMAELVLDKSLLPSYIQPVSTNDLKYEQKGTKAVPYIKQASETIYLDSPTIKSIVINQDPDSAYSDSWFESAVQAIVASEEYRNDIRKAFRKASLPRVTAEIDVEKFTKSLSPEIQYDPVKMKAAMDAIIEGIEDQLNGLNPEDCLVSFDTVKVQHLSQGNTSTHESLKVHSNIMNGLVSTGLKTLPSILGRGESQSVASTESVLFLKVCEGVQGRVNELFSSLLTLAARLQGHDVVVMFKYKKPDLRPDAELESFYAMKQSRILEQLSLGLISDEEASIILTGDLPSESFTPLSGTMFHQKAEPVENPYSGTSVSGDQLNKTKDQKDRSKTDTKPKTTQTAG